MRHALVVIVNDAVMQKSAGRRLDDRRNFGPVTVLVVRVVVLPSCRAGRLAFS